jgi:hypothetical protein
MVRGDCSGLDGVCARDWRPDMRISRGHSRELNAALVRVTNSCNHVPMGWSGIEGRQKALGWPPRDVVAGHLSGYIPF